MDEVKQEETVICQACNKVIEQSNNAFVGSYVTFTSNNKELGRMHFDCHVKGCIWAAKQAYEAEKSELYRKEFVENHWSWDYDSDLNNSTAESSSYTAIKEDLEKICTHYENLNSDEKRFFYIDRC